MLHAQLTVTLLRRHVLARCYTLSMLRRRCTFALHRAAIVPFRPKAPCPIATAVVWELSSRPTVRPSHGTAPQHEPVVLHSLTHVLYMRHVAAAPGMERHTLLNELREHGRLPEAWERAHPRVAQLIRWARWLGWGQDC